MPKNVVQTVAYIITTTEQHFPFVSDIFDFTGGIYWQVKQKKILSRKREKFIPKILMSFIAIIMILTMFSDFSFVMV